MNVIKVLSVVSGVNANILPVIEYGSVVQRLKAKTGKLKLQWIQNVSARMVLGVQKWSKSSAALREVGQMLLENRMEPKQVRVTAKVLMDNGHLLHDELSGKLWLFVGHRACQRFL